MPKISKPNPVALALLEAGLVDLNRPSTRRVRKIVTPSGRRPRGAFPSRKSEIPVKYESLIEKMTLRVLEVAPSVRKFVTQPRVFEFHDASGKRRYTPDIAVTTDGYDILIEVKDDSFSLDSESVRRLRGVVEHLRNEGLTLVFVLRSDVQQNGLQNKLELLLRDRPARGRYRDDIDTTLWDPEIGTCPTPDLQQLWESAKRECDELLQRVMRRDPDDLLRIDLDN